MPETTPTTSRHNQSTTLQSSAQSNGSGTEAPFPKIAPPVLSRQLSLLSLNLEKTPGDVFEVATTLTQSGTDKGSEATHKPDSTLPESKAPAVTGTATTGNEYEPSSDLQEKIHQARRNSLKKW